MSKRCTRIQDYSFFSSDHPGLYRLAKLADASEYLTSFVKLLLWLGLTVLAWNLVSYALFPTEFIMMPVEPPFTG